jgi:anti-sigma regulatory factor (Ser/Thr protein kinase)
MNERSAQHAGFLSESPESRGRISVALAPLPSSISAARRAVGMLLVDADPSDEFSFSLRLVVSELITNAVVHGSAGDEIRLDLTLHRDHAHVSIHNLGAGFELTKFRREGRNGGRGLEIVAALSERWGIDTGRTGTTMTARVPRYV